MCIAVPALVESRQPGSNMLIVRTLDFRYEAAGDLVPDAVPGDWVLVHMGFAITKVSYQDAQDCFDLLDWPALPPPRDGL